MRRLLRETGQIIKFNIKNLLLFEVIYRLVTAPIYLRFMDLGIKAILKLNGYSFLTLGNLGKILLNPGTILILLGVSLVGVLILTVEIGGLITAFSGAAYYLKLPWTEILSGGVHKLIDEMRRKNFAILLMALVNYLLVNLYLIYRVFTHVKPLNFMMRTILEEPVSRMLLVVGLVLCVIGFAPVMFVWYGCMVEQKSFRDSCARSRELLKDHVIPSVILMGGGNVAAILLMIITYLVCVLAAALIVVLAVDKKMEFAFLLAACDRIELVLLFLFSSIICMVNFASLTVLYYQYSSRLKREPRWDFDFTGQKVLKKKYALVAGVLMCVVSAVCMFDVAWNGSVITKAVITDIGITAHRGSSKTAPENTMAAIEAAVEELADYAEIDVQESSDGYLVLCHDSSLKRVAGIKRNVSELTFEQLMELDVGSWFSPEFAGERIPTLEEVMAYAKGKINLNIEIKNAGSGSRMPEMVLKLIEEYGMEEQCVVTSTALKYLVRIKELNPDIKTGYIISAAYGRYYEEDSIDFISLRSSFVTKRLVTLAHESGKEIHAWTVNSKSEMERVKALGVDNIITDYPVRARELIYGEEATETLLGYLRLILR